MKKLILIDHEPWSKRRKELFYDLFKEAGVDLIVFDLYKIIVPNYKVPDFIESAEYLYRFNSINEFAIALAKYNPRNTIIIEEYNKNWENRKILLEINKLGFKKIKLNLYGNSLLLGWGGSTYLDRLKRLRKSGLKRAFTTIINSIRYNLYKKFHHIEDTPIIFSSSILDKQYPINHPDYEIFHFKSHTNIIQGEYIVYCDDYFPFHPDLSNFYKNKHLPDGEKYLKTMRKFFDNLEKRYNIPIVIAAHPKSDYKGLEFGNRKIIKGCTCDLVFHSKMVALKYCNSISFSLLGNKPIVLFGTNDYLSLDDNRSIINILGNDLLKIPVYNLDIDDFEEIEFKKIPNEYRLKYIYSYLTSKETEEIPNYRSINKYLQKI